jgi:hypothetical protein
MELKIFVGTRGTPDLTLPENLLKVPIQGKEYIGLYSEGKSLKLKDIHHAASFVRESLASCNNSRVDHLKMVVFLQLFCG